LRFSGKCANIPKDFSAEFTTKKLFPADMEFSEKIADIPKNFLADFVTKVISYEYEVFRKIGRY
jgi:hypothetical protein